MKRASTILLAVVLLAVLPASAAELAGVKLPDSADVAGKTLVLNGLGLREATFLRVDVYVAGLYLEAKTKDASAIIGSDAPKRLVMHFVRKVGKSDITKAWTEGFEANSPDLYAAVKDRVATMNGWMQDVVAGDEMVFTYVPGEGTTVEVKGKAAGTIPGLDFAQALWSVWMGPKPPNAGLKTGLLGG